MTYNKMTKKELIVLLENESKEKEKAANGHLDALHELAMVTKNAQYDAEQIKALRYDLYMAERTIARLIVNETVQLDMEESE